MAARTTATGWTVAAILSGLVLAVADASARTTGPPAHAATAGAIGGGVDADVRTRDGGRLLGHLHGHVATSGRGTAVFTPTARSRLAGVRLTVTARATGARRAAMRARGYASRLRFGVSRAATLRGRGRLAGHGVVVVGVARDRVPRLRKGLKMLVVGRPHGEGYRTMKRYFRPVRYRPHHTRARYLRSRRAFHSFGALVLGGGLGRQRIAEHPLLRTFYGAGKWVVVAPASLASLRAVGQVHAYVGGRRAAALAVRQVGPEGDARRVKATVAYPEPARRLGPLRPTARQRRESAANRAEFFLSQLRRMAAPHMATARRPGAGARAAARAAQLTSGSFSLPLNAAAMEIMVPVFHGFTLSASQNAEQSKPCGWDVTRSEAHCPDSWGRFPPWWEAGAANKAAACQWHMSNGFHILDQDSVMAFAGGRNAGGVYTGVEIPDRPSFDERFYRQAAEWGDECPANRAQTGNIQGTDYYYAIFEPGSTPAHTIVASSELTISATDPPKDQTQEPKLAFPGEYNGRGRMYRWVQSSSLFPGRWDFDGAFPRETAWFLGAYDHTFALTGDNVGSEQLEYIGARSAPQLEITQAASSTGYSASQSFNVGIFDDVFTGGISKSESRDASITIYIPSWRVRPSPGPRSITYNWRTNTPVSWDTITGGGGGPHDLNDLNVTDFSPSSLTTWSGNPTWGKVSIAVDRTVHLIDHWSRYDRSSSSIVDGGYHDTQLRYTDRPDDISPRTGSAAGPGINLCDPQVIYAKEFWDQCAGLQATVSVTAVCSNSSWTTIAFQVGSLTTAKSSCNKPSSPMPVGTGQDVVVELLTPSFATAGSTTCTDQNGAVVTQQSGDKVTIPAGALKPKTQIACKMNLS